MRKVKRSAGVASEVNLRNSAQARNYTSEGSTLSPGGISAADYM